ncbi:MAG: site-2 protease family protein [Candidatus Heteroscillospira sp.]|jgi:Zn-dependent protease
MQGGAVIEGFVNIWNNLDWTRLIDLLMPVVPAIICISVHELSHGLAAYLMGDDTARRQGRISLNPLRHIDPFGFIMLVVLGFGWAKPVNVDMRRFKNPKRGMALTALAGPLSNVLLCALLMPVYGVLMGAVWKTDAGAGQTVLYYAVRLVSTTAYLSLSLAVFNLIPIPPLDGSKIVEAVLPQRIYWQIMRYERWGMILLFLAVWSGVFSKPLHIVTEGIFGYMLYIAQWGYELIIKLF